MDRAVEIETPTEPKTLTLAESLALVERRRTEGRRDEAEALCRKILATRPDQPEAIHLLAVLAHQGGRIREAIELTQRAIKLAPKVALYHSNLGEMWRLAGQPRRAIEEGERALALQPDYPEALSNRKRPPLTRPSSSAMSWHVGFLRSLEELR